MSLRVALLANGTSIHVVRWANALAEHGHEVHVLSSRLDREQLAAEIHCHELRFAPPGGYFLNAIQVRRLLAAIRPNVLNTHFVSGYGTLGRLSGFTPNVLSVWGSDVYEFPDRSQVHRKLIEANLRAATWVCSTSNVMAERTRQIVPVERLSVVPFGVDTDVFRPVTARTDDGRVVIGTVKALYPKYGIDLLIRAFAELRRRLWNVDMRLASRLELEIVGSGPSEAELRSLGRELGVAEVTRFVGQVPYREVPSRLGAFDVYVALSRFESFGVAILEASACGIPVVVANVGGLPEVVRHGRTGFVVPKEDAPAAAGAIAKLVLDAALRRDFGVAGRRHVIKAYSWPRCVKRLDEILRCASGKASSPP